jgi:solute carrier family 25 carnitine/acylcarnitine transporter 20/29
MPEQEERRQQLNALASPPRDLTDVSRAVLRSEQAKRWTKRYRTEVAASSSSLLSTVVAVYSSLRGTPMQSYR